VASRWAVVSTRDGFISKQASLEVAVEVSMHTTLVPRFVAWWTGKRGWVAFDAYETIKVLDHVDRHVDEDGNERGSTVHHRPETVFGLYNAARARQGHAPLTFDGYMALVAARFGWRTDVVGDG